MSIAIALGVTTPETSYADMAAGSDPESVEASPAVNEKTYSNHSCGTVQTHGYRGLPYAMQQSSVVCCQDHNYGAPPPPTPPASPLSQTIIPRLELNGVARGRYHSPHGGHPAATHANAHHHAHGHPNHGHAHPHGHGGRPEQEHSADSETSSDEEDEEDDGSVPISWCRCSPGGFIMCEYCRGLERRKALDGQRRKAENVSVGESSGTESGDEEVSPSTVSYTATQHTPTSITLTVNRVKRSKGKKRKKSTEKSRTTPKTKKAFREGSRKSMRMKNSTTDTVAALDENTAEGWETRIRQWTEQYEEALVNQYSADVQTLLTLQLAKPSSPSSAPSPDAINRTELACNNTVLSSQMQLQVGRVTRVQKHRKILRAARDLEPDALIIEYRGKVMLKQQFEVNGQFFKKPYPFVLFYSKFNEVEMCVDARTFGNDARFIRRSCTPNAEVRHVISEGMIHLCIYAVAQITKDSEVTIGFDYEFSSCNYKVDCACQKGNQNCPVQKHNSLSPDMLRPTPSSSPAVPSLPGAETRRRRARRQQMEVGGPPGTAGSDDSNQQPNGDAQDREHGASDAEDDLLDGLKAEEGEEGELDDNGVLISSRRSQDGYDLLDRRRRRVGQGAADDLKQEPGGLEEGEVTGLSPSAANPLPGMGSTTAGVSTRRASYATEVPVEAGDVKPMAAPVTTPKPPPAPRTSKPRPKSRISRYRSGSAQRARRQRQALAQQAAEAAAAAAAAAAGEDGAVGPYQGEMGLGEGAYGAGLAHDGDGYGPAGAGGLGSKGNMRYPKTKKYLVTEWLNDKVPGGGGAGLEAEVERPLRISTDPTVLATTLNMLPGLSHNSLICTAPKHYVRFGSPFTPERRRRPSDVDASYGSCKKRWIKQALDESKSQCGGDAAASGSSSQKSSTAPFKKRKSKYAPELLLLGSPPGSSGSGGGGDLLVRPLSPITPPPPSSSSSRPHLTTSCALYLGAEDERLNGGSGSLGGATISMPYSPLTSLPTSRCNTPLQFENISSPEASPVHRPESLSPEPCLRPDFDAVRNATFPDLSMTSSLDSPIPPPCDVDFPAVSPSPLSLSGGNTPLPLTPASATGGDSAAPAGCTRSGSTSSEAQAREQAFRTEFNLIYACSPLNANLGGAGGGGGEGPLGARGGAGGGSLIDRRHSMSEGSYSPADSYFGSGSGGGGASGQGLLSEAGAAGSLSPYPEPHYGGGYPDSGTPPHPSNPPQKKKRANVTILSHHAGSVPGYQSLAIRGQCKPMHNMVSLLEYRKRKQGGTREAGECGGSVGGGTPTRPGSLCPSAESPAGLRTLLQHPASPSPSPHSHSHGSFSSPSPAHHQAFPPMEEVSPPLDARDAAGPRTQEAPSWMVPTTVERLREGQGVLERVLRGSLKIERALKRSEPGDHGNHKDTDSCEMDRYDLSAASPMRSPHRYSPSVYQHQPQLSEPHPASDNSASPFRSSYSPSPTPYQRPLSQELAPHTTPPPPTASLLNSSSSSSSLSSSLSSSSSVSSLDSSVSGTSRPPGGSTHPQSGGGGGGGSGAVHEGLQAQPYSSNISSSGSSVGHSHLKASLLNSSIGGGGGLPSSASSSPPMSRGQQQQQSHSKSDNSSSSSSVGSGGLLSGNASSRLAQQGSGRGLQASSRLLAAASSNSQPHYPPRGAPALSQFQHPPLQGSGVRTQTGSY
ncbi:histone-lysine N-methyltransferase SETD5 isoform X2 [Engraulis encrasicolus]|uniref:histone-lysine N-methyltransferase SETD5 isoform X2 n=1 Tax=Engraulis encrasicolus TaxID=184585 RepID=UPI002FD45459